MTTTAYSAALLLSLLAGGTALAQDFPNGKPITLIIPFAPGGSVDTGLRVLVPALERELGTSIIVENKNGAGGQSGLTDFIRTAEPDGLTLVNLGLPTVITQYLDPQRATIYNRESFQPVAQTWTGWDGIAVAADSPIQSLDELIALAKEQPSTVTIADAGLMTAPHLCVALLEKATGVKFASVHFDGGAAATAGLLGGHVQAMVGGASDFISNYDAGMIRILGVATEKPVEGLAGVETLATLGIPLVCVKNQGVAVPAGTPEPIVRRLEAAFKKVLTEDPTVEDEMKKYGNPADFAGADQFVETWKKDEGDLGPLLKELQAAQ